MSTSLLYHGFGLTDHEHLKIKYKGGNIIFYIQTKKNSGIFKNKQIKYLLKL